MECPEPWSETWIGDAMPEPTPAPVPDAPLPRGLSWKPLVGTVTASGSGLGAGIALAHGDPFQIAVAAAAWSMTVTAAIVVWVANVLVSRRYVHAEELVRERAAAMTAVTLAREAAADAVALAHAAALKREAELAEDRDYWRGDAERWRDQALHTSRDVAEPAIAALVKAAEGKPP